MRTKHFATGMLLLAITFASGCVSREMVITSEPAGATVTINQTFKGVTPVTYNFNHYGVYDIMIEKEGYYPLHVAEPVKAPLYERTGPDLVASMAPVRLKDTHKLHYKLQKREEEDDKEAILQRLAETKTRTENIAKATAEKEKNKVIKAKVPLLKTKKKQKKEDSKENKKAAPEQPVKTKPEREEGTAAQPVAPAASKESSGETSQ